MSNPTPPIQTSSLPPIQSLEFDQPLKWLLLGWKDIARHPFWNLLLELTATGWVLNSLTLITLAASQAIHTHMDFIHHIVLATKGYLFEIWLVMAGLMSLFLGLIFVKSMPGNASWHAYKDLMDTHHLPGRLSSEAL